MDSNNIIDQMAYFKNFTINRNDKIVAYGCVFIETGKCVVNWRGEYRSVVIWDSLDDLKKVSGHPGTSFVFY